MSVATVNSRFNFPLVLLGKSERFVTADAALKRKILLLPDSHWHINSSRFVLIVGGEGVGKKTLVHHAWRKFRHRQLIGLACQRVKSVQHLELYFDAATGGDLFLEDIHVLPTRLQQQLPRLQTKHRNVRVLATAESIDCNELNALVIPIPSLQQRSGDNRPLLDYFLRNVFQNMHMSTAVQNRICTHRFAAAKEIFTYLANLAFICSYSGRRNVDARMLQQAQDFTTTERLQLQIMYFISNSGMQQLLDDHTLPELCHLLENSLIANSLLEAKHSQTLASRLLRIPATTLSSKKPTLPVLLRKGL